MQLADIRRLVEVAVKDEVETGRVAAVLRSAAEANGVRPSSVDMMQTIAFLASYAREAVTMLETLQQEAAAAGHPTALRPLIEMATKYFLEPNDLIPEHQGLAGVLDDAYLALRVIEVASDYLARTHGRPLIATDLGPANKLVAHLLGPQITQLLEMAVVGAQHQGIHGAFPAMSQIPRPMNVGHPIYGNASVDEIVRLEMGRHGIV